MKFMYLGEGSTTIFGHTFKSGEPVEVTDERSIGKLKNMTTLFAHNEEPEASAPKVEEPAKRMGRPPKAKTDGQN
jgi:hypothetical protein